MIDKELVVRKSVLINKDLDELKVISKKTLKEFVSSDSEVLAERYLERIITRMIDVNYHIVVETGNAPPSDYFQSFLQLSKIGVLPYGFSQEIAKSAGLRNRLVHEYDEIDPELIFEYIKTAINDVPEYLRKINEFIRG